MIFSCLGTEQYLVTQVVSNAGANNQPEFRYNPQGYIAGLPG